MASFSVGEIAIGQNLQHVPRYNGVECEIISSLRERKIRTHDGVPCIPYYIRGYKVRWADGTMSNQEPRTLRKRPPKEDARKWFDENIKLNPKVLEEA